MRKRNNFHYILYYSHLLLVVYSSVCVCVPSRLAGEEMHVGVCQGLCVEIDELHFQPFCVLASNHENIAYCELNFETEMFTFWK